MQDRKFFVTQNRVVDIDVVGDVEYIPVGGKSDQLWEFEEPTKEPIFKLRFITHPSVTEIRLTGAEADQAWENFRSVYGSERLIKKPTEPEQVQEERAMTPDELVTVCVKSDLGKGVKHFDESGKLLETTDEILETLRRERQVTVQPMYGPRTVNHLGW